MGVGGGLRRHETVLGAVVRGIKVRGGVLGSTRVLTRYLGLKKGVVATKGNNSTSRSRRFSSRVVKHLGGDEAPFPSLSLDSGTSLLAYVKGSFKFREVFSQRVRNVNAAGSIFVTFAASYGSEGVVRTLGMYGGSGVGSVIFAKRYMRSVSLLTRRVVVVPDGSMRVVRRYRSVVSRVIYRLMRRVMSLGAIGR